MNGRWLRAACLVFSTFSAARGMAEEQSLRALIDTEVAAAWQREKVTPAEPATDTAFLRRIYLDLVGTIPTYDETVAFLDSPSPGKRGELIDRLLEDPRFAQHQADIWDMVFFGRNPPGYDTDKRDAFQAWLREQFATNVPYDRWAGQILRAEGNTVEQGPPMYYVQYRNQPEDASEAISQTFLGIQMQCARCHDHPFEEWSQLDFYGMAAFLSRLDVVSVGKKENLTMYAIAEKSSGDILFTGPVKEQQPGKKGDPVKPKFLHGDPLQEPPLPDGFKEVKFENDKPPPKPLFSRKDQLADWIASPTNPYFARAVANRVWAQFLGRGLVHPVDNMSPSKQPTHPQLLDALAKGLVEHKFDLKWYIRELVNTRTYQTSSAGLDGEARPKWFERGRVRPLSAEELADAWRVATGYAAVEQAAPKGAAGPGRSSEQRFRPLVADYMLRFFGQPNNGVGDFQGGLDEHLFLNNGPLGSLIVSGPGSLLDALANAPPEQRVDRLYLSLLNRRAIPEERVKFVEYFAPSGNPQDLLRDAIWVLMTCSEFRFNH